MINTILISGNYNVFNEGWNGAGVYMCSGNYKSDTFALPIYIGSSINLQQRIETAHIDKLNRNKHPHNKILQFSWNKHSEKDGFIWWLLESCEKEKTLEIEQKYLDLYQPFVDEFGGFNIGHFATSGMKGQKISDETRKKMSESAKKRPPISEETRKKQSFHSSNASPETRKLISDANAKTYQFVNPEGEKITIHNLTKFCEENNLKFRNMISVNSGKQKSCKGWTKYGRKLHKLLSPEGKIISFYKIVDICKKYNLWDKYVGMLLSNKLLEYKGWKNVE